jgi:tRNA dimethylallyltransferase
VSHELFIITGPTAVGKTSLALEWAEANGAEILSCDSLLVYQGMNVGTAKPTSEELLRVPHHGIDLVPAREPYNVARYVGYAAEVVADIMARGKRVLVCGGSGFYLKSFFEAVVDAVEIPQEVQDHVDALWAAEGLLGVVKALRKASPGDCDSIDLCNSRRVLPALKRCLATGLSITALRQRLKDTPFPFSGYRRHCLLLQRDHESLKTRIAARIQLMLDGGLLDEVRLLLDLGLLENPSAREAIGYRECIAVLQGTLEASALASEINRNTLHLVSKQRKWFNTQLPANFVRVLNLETPLPEMNQWFQDEAN